jgi:Flp pilus assembly protein TadG
MKTTRSIRKKIRHRRGVSVVEAAMVMPVVFMFVFGVLEYGRYVMTLQVLTNACREGARYAMIHPQPVTVSGTTYGNATSDVQAIIDKALAGQRLNGQTVSIYAADSLGNNIGSWNSAQAGQSVCVQINGNYNAIIPTLLRMPSSFAVTSKAVMRTESN